MVIGSWFLIDASPSPSVSVEGVRPFAAGTGGCAFAKLFEACRNSAFAKRPSACRAKVRSGFDMHWDNDMHKDKDSKRVDRIRVNATRFQWIDRIAMCEAIACAAAFLSACRPRDRLRPQAIAANLKS